MKEKTVFIPILYPELKNKNSKMNFIFYLEDISSYDKKEGKRKIKKSDISIDELISKTGKDEVLVRLDNGTRKIQLQEINLFGKRSSIYNNLNKMTKGENKSLILKEEGDYYVLDNDVCELENPNKKAFTISLSHQTLETMYTRCNDLTIKLYLYLYRQHNYWTTIRKRKSFGFTLTYLCEELGLSTTNVISRRKMYYALETLQTMGFILYGTKEKDSYRSYYTIEVYRVPMNIVNGAQYNERKDNESKEPSIEESQNMADDDSLPNTNLFSDKVLIDNKGNMTYISLQDVLGRLGLNTKSLSYTSMVNSMKEAIKRPENSLFFSLHKDEINDKMLYSGDSI